jgi:hypothetical protein
MMKERSTPENYTPVWMRQRQLSLGEVQGFGFSQRLNPGTMAADSKRGMNRNLTEGHAEFAMGERKLALSSPQRKKLAGQASPRLPEMLQDACPGTTANSTYVEHI